MERTDPMLDIYNPYGLNNAYLPPKYNKMQAYGPINPNGIYGMQHFGKSPAHIPENLYGTYVMQQYNGPYPDQYQYQNIHQSPCLCFTQGKYHTQGPYHTQGQHHTQGPNYVQGQHQMQGSGQSKDRPVIMDYGPAPFVIDIEEAALQNSAFRTALWTGRHLQVTLMSIRPGEDTGLEIHPELDQFIRIEEGRGIAMMGDRKDRLDLQRHVQEDYIIIVPAGKWHNLINTGQRPIKLYSIYAPPQHPHGTVHLTKADAEAAEHHH